MKEEIKNLNDKIDSINMYNQRHMILNHGKIIDLQNNQFKLKLLSLTSLGIGGFSLLVLLMMALIDFDKFQSFFL